MQAEHMTTIRTSLGTAKRVCLNSALSTTDEEERNRLVGEMEKIDATLAALEAAQAASTLAPDDERIALWHTINTQADYINELEAAQAGECWTPVPKSLQYDLVTHAIRTGEIPAEYVICEPTTPQPGTPPAPAALPVEVASTINTAIASWITSITIEVACGDVAQETLDEAMSEAKAAQAWLDAQRRPGGEAT